MHQDNLIPLPSLPPLKAGFGHDIPFNWRIYSSIVIPYLNPSVMLLVIASIWHISQAPAFPNDANTSNGLPSRIFTVIYRFPQPVTILSVLPCICLGLAFLSPYYSHYKRIYLILWVTWHLYI